MIAGYNAHADHGTVGMISILPDGKASPHTWSPISDNEAMSHESGSVRYDRVEHTYQVIHACESLHHESKGEGTVIEGTIPSYGAKEWHST